MVRRNLGSETISAWRDGLQKEGQHDSRRTTHFRESTIYSYSFPMAVRRIGWYLLNGDDGGWATTRRHQSLVRGALLGRNYTIVPFSALTAASCDVQTLQILDTEPDREIKIPGLEYPVHLMGASVLRDGGRYFLSGVDESGSNPWTSFFLTELTGPVSTVPEAYDSLKPWSVKQAERFSWEVLRQGEWFFVRLPDDSLLALKLRRLFRSGSPDLQIRAYLPPAAGRRKRHYVTRLYQEPDTDRLFASGTSRHVGGQHKMLKLGKVGRDWHHVYHNQQVMSWTATGAVD